MSFATQLSKRYWLFLAAVLIGLSSSAALLPAQETAARALNSAGPRRPASVPDDYVITPFGYSHPSCVATLAQGERLLPNGRIQHSDGPASTSLGVCEHPRYSSSGVPIGRIAPNVAPEFSGWLENANVTTGSPTKSYGGLIAYWTVPPGPVAQDGQILFFFPGLEDINNPQTSILQPVLQWAEGQWAVANWNCCPQNITVRSPYINVSPGDRILGAISSTCASGTLSCPTWNILSLDFRTGESTTLNTPSQGQVFNWAFGGVLEPYFILSCDDFPDNSQANFNVTIFDENLRPIGSPQWTTASATAVTPECGYGVRAKPHLIALHY